MKTYTYKGDYTERVWYVVDAKDQILGRLAARIATILRGKHKPVYSPHIDVGDAVIVINADKVRVSGKKAQQKIYYRHTEYPGGLRKTQMSHLMQTRPERVIEKAIKGMLPKNSLGRSQFRKLKVYAGSDHPHQAQNPTLLDIANSPLVH